MLGIMILNYNQYQKTIDCINTIFETTKSEYIIIYFFTFSEEKKTMHNFLHMVFLSQIVYYTV